jgi:hypothetical protein
MIDITIWHWLAFTAVVIAAVFFEIADDVAVRLHGTIPLLITASIFGTALSTIFTGVVALIVNYLPHVHAH